MDPSRQDAGEPAGAPRRSSSGKRRLLGTAALVLVAMVALMLVPRGETRVEGRPISAWFDELFPETTVMDHAAFAAHPIRKTLSAHFASAPHRLEDEVSRQLEAIERLDRHYQRQVRLSSILRGLTGGSVPLPDVSQMTTARERLQRHLQAVMGIWLDLSTNRAATLDRVEVLAAAGEESAAAMLARGFWLVDDNSGLWTAELTRRATQDSTPTARRVLWIECLRQLGPQAASSADHVREWCRRPVPLVRPAAIRALGSIDEREDTAEFLRQCAFDAEGRQAVMVALLAMGPRARPVEDLVRQTLNDPEWLTAFFAKQTLDRITGSTNAGDSSLAPAGGPSPGR